MMKLLSAEVSNFRKIRMAKVEFPNDGVVMITGLNETGKTTFLRAIEAPLRGKGNLPHTLLSHDEKSGVVKLEIGDEDRKPLYTVVLNYTKVRGPMLKLFKASGETVSGQQSILNTFWNTVAMRPLDFAEAKQDEQRRILLESSILHVGEDFTERTGLAEPEKDVLAQLKRREDHLFELRGDANRIVKDLKGKLEAYKDVPDGLGDVSMQELLDEQTRRQSLQTQRMSIINELAGKRSRIIELEKTVEQLKKDVGVLEERLSAIPEQDLVGIKNELLKAQQAKQSQEKAQLEKELEAAEKEADENNKALEDVREYTKSLTDTMELPLPELGFDEDEGFVTYEGEPLDARGDSRWIKIGMAVGIATGAEVDLILIKQGNDLDKNSVKEIMELAQKHGKLVIMERENPVDGALLLEIDEGEVKEVPDE